MLELQEQEKLMQTVSLGLPRPTVAGGGPSDSALSLARAYGLALQVAI